METQHQQVADRGVHSVTKRADFLALGVGSIGMLCIVLLPLLVISLFNHSYADDWHYGVWAHLALQHSGGNVGAALAEALRQVVVAWFDWQGTYSAIFLMAIQPGVFSESAYIVSAWLVLALLVGCTFYFVHAGMQLCLSDHSYAWLSVASAVLIIQILLQPSPVEGIFWYNSALYYTGYHALLLLLIGFVIRTMAVDKPWVLAVRVFVATLLALFVAGGNFVTLLVALEVGIIATLVAVVKRSSKVACIAIPTIALVLGALVSFSAPGNDVRQQTQFPDTKLGVVDTLVQSVVAGLRYLTEWSSGFVLLMLLFLLPLVVYVLHHSGAAKTWSFSYPGLVSIASVALFVSSFTPTFYSMGTAGPGRVQNCRFDLMVVLGVINLIWWTGWVVHRRLTEEAAVPGSAAAVRDVVAVHDLAVAVQDVDSRSGNVAFGHGDPQHASPSPHLPFSAQKASSICAAIGLIFAVSLGAIYLDDGYREKLSSLSALHSVVTGQAQAYDKQVSHRIYLIETSHEQELKVPFYQNVPHVLLMGDIRDTMDNYINYRLAQWYGKKSIIGYSPYPSQVKKASR